METQDAIRIITEYQPKNPHISVRLDWISPPLNLYRTPFFQVIAR